MSALTFAPIFNLRIGPESVDLDAGFNLPFVLARIDFDLFDVPATVGEFLSLDSFHSLDGHLTFVVVPRDCESPEQLQHIHSTIEVDNFLTAVRLVTDSPVVAPIIWTEWEGVKDRLRSLKGEYVRVTSYHERWAVMNRLDLLGKSYDEFSCELGAKSLDKLKVALDALARRPPDSRRLELALQRYNSAMERARAEDAIIDLFIALEALLIDDAYYMDTGRLIEQKAKLVVETNGGDKISDISGHYWVRNQIVHGRNSDYNAEKALIALTRDTRKILMKLLTRPELSELLRDGGFSKN